MNSSVSKFATENQLIIYSDKTGIHLNKIDDDQKLKLVCSYLDCCVSNACNISISKDCKMVSVGTQFSTLMIFGIMNNNIELVSTFNFFDSWGLNNFFCDDNKYVIFSSRNPNESGSIGFSIGNIQTHEVISYKTQIFVSCVFLENDILFVGMIDGIIEIYRRSNNDKMKFDTIANIDINEKIEDFEETLNDTSYPIYNDNIIGIKTISDDVIIVTLGDSTIIAYNYIDDNINRIFSGQYDDHYDPLCIGNYCPEKKIIVVPKSTNMVEIYDVNGKLVHQYIDKNTSKVFTDASFIHGTNMIITMENNGELVLYEYQYNQSLE